jgi:4-amino-4-deoxy-L-arabinose transferase-like glycosyltransferase
VISEPDQVSRPVGWAPTLWLIGSVMLARLVYVALACPYALVEDEAHYWEWSRHLDWSYYSKGPGIAWLIAASIRVFGDSEAAVRAAAPVLGAVTAIAIAGLARDVTGSGRAAFLAAACFMLAPFFQISSILMTIDTPYLAAWALACWSGWRAIALRRSSAWPALGAAIGVGLLFKYTMLSLVPGLLLFAWLDRKGRPAPVPRVGGRGGGVGIVIALAIVAVALAPILYWNARNGWPSVQHLLGHLGVDAGDVPVKARGRWRYDPGWALEFVAIQLVILGPVLYLGVLGLFRGLRSADPAQRRGFLFLLCGGLPILAFYLALTAVTRAEGNWAIAAFVTLLPAAGWALASEVAGARWLWRVSVIVGITVGVLMLRLDWVAASAPASWLDRALQRAGLKGDRPLIPIGRLTAAPALAADAARLGAELRVRTGLEPFYVAEHYGRASLLAFYLPGRPVVYCSSSMLDEGRRTQYDFWAGTDLGDFSVLGGRPAVCLGKSRERWEAAFVTVEDRGRLEGEPKSDRRVFLCFGYRGFGDFTFRETKPLRR